jgi:hypothetical protein
MIQAGPSSWDRRDDVKGNREAYYTDAHNFEPIEAARAREKADQDEYWFANRYSFEWEDFCAQVQFSSRFFSIKERLDGLFGKPEEYGEGPVKPLYNLAAGVPALPVLLPRAADRSLRPTSSTAFFLGQAAGAAGSRTQEVPIVLNGECLFEEHSVALPVLAESRASVEGRRFPRDGAPYLGR